MSVIVGNVKEKENDKFLALYNVEAILAHALHIYPHIVLLYD
jgi:hypothetical protein